jgi:hypothetical protein
MKFTSTGYRSYESADGAFDIQFCANANRDGGGYGQYRASRNVGPFPMTMAESISFHNTKAGAVEWCIRSSAVTPIPVNA